MFCQKCGNELPDGSIFCSRCGFPVAGVTARQYPAAAAPKSKAVPTIVVLAIIGACFVPFFGILAAIAIPNFVRAMDKANYTRCMQSLMTLKSAEQMYISDNGNYIGKSAVEKLGMYIIPGCKNPNGCGNAVEERIIGKSGKGGSCKDFDIVTLSGGGDYKITGTANDRNQCKICVNVNGFLPDKYSDCKPNMQMVCP